MLVTFAELQNWVSGALGPSEVMDPKAQSSGEECLKAAQSFVERRCNRILEKLGTAVTVILDGNESGGRDCEVLFLPKNHRPVALGGSDTVVVTENGTTLTVGSGFSTAYDVLVQNAGQDAQARLLRCSRGWTQGRQNIAATYKYGGAVDMDKHLIKQLAWLFYREPKLLGMVSKSKSGSSVSVESKLPDTVRQLLEVRTVL